MRGKPIANPGFMLARHKLFFIPALISILVTSLLVFARLNTQAHNASSKNFEPARDLEMAFIGDSLATDIVRTHRFLRDAFRCATPTTLDLVTGRGSAEHPLGIIDWLSPVRPLRITNYSRPGSDVFSREFLNDPPQWQRWVVRISNFEQLVDSFLEKNENPQLIAVWMGHVDLLYWNTYKGGRDQRLYSDFAPLMKPLTDEELADWITNLYRTKFEAQLNRIIHWANTHGKKSIVVYGLLDWNEVNRLTREIQKIKNTDPIRFLSAEDRVDPQGQLNLWKKMNLALKDLVERLSHDLHAPSTLRYSSAMESIVLTPEDIASDGIHPTSSGKSRLAQEISSDLIKLFPDMFNR